MFFFFVFRGGGTCSAKALFPKVQHAIPKSTTEEEGLANEAHAVDFVSGQILLVRDLTPHQVTQFSIC